MITRFNEENNAAAPDDHKECFRQSFDGVDVVLMQHKEYLGSYAVQYGKQVTDGLRYTQACTELGSVIMHALMCQGMFDD